MEIFTQSTTLSERRLNFRARERDLGFGWIRSSIRPTRVNKVVGAPLRPLTGLSWESVAWLALALSALIVLVVSFSV